MKKLIIVFILVIVAVGCNKNTEVDAVLEKNCTGSYVHLNDKYYLICNDKTVEDLENGTEISVAYKNVNECEGSNDFICLMAFQFDGFIEITKIKKK